MKSNSPRKQYPSIYEKIIPIALVVIGLAIIVLLVVIALVALGKFPTIN